MRRLPRQLVPHAGSEFQPFLGSGSRGPAYGPAVSIKRSQVEQKTRLVRDKDGREVVSSTTVYADALWTIPPGSLLTVHKGRPAEATSKVIGTEFMEHPSVGAYIAVRLE